MARFLLALINLKRLKKKVHSSSKYCLYSNTDFFFLIKRKLMNVIKLKILQHYYVGTFCKIKI